MLYLDAPGGGRLSPRVHASQSAEGPVVLDGRGIERECSRTRKPLDEPGLDRSHQLRVCVGEMILV